jgi:hypothetical protein
MGIWRGIWWLMLLLLLWLVMVFQRMLACMLLLREGEELLLVVVLLLLLLLLVVVVVVAFPFPFSMTSSRVAEQHPGGTLRRSMRRTSPASACVSPGEMPNLSSTVIPSWAASTAAESNSRVEKFGSSSLRAKISDGEGRVSGKNTLLLLLLPLLPSPPVPPPGTSTGTDTDTGTGALKKPGTLKGDGTVAGNLDEGGGVVPICLASALTTLSAAGDSTTSGPLLLVSSLPGLLLFGLCAVLPENRAVR